MSDDLASADIGVRIRELRQRRALTVTELARRINVTTACVSQWENRKRPPAQKLVEPLAHALQTHVGFLLTGKGDPDNMPEGGQFAIPAAAVYVIDQARKMIADELGLPLAAVRVQISVPPKALIGSSLEIAG